MEQLVNDIRNGNIRAFKQLFEDYYPILCVYSQQYITDPESCKDIAQEVLLTYWERRKNFNEIHQLKSFLYTATRNRCLNWLKHATFIDEEFEKTRNISDEDVFEEEIMRQETFLLVRKAIATLPPQMQRIVKLYMAGKHNQEIAELLQISEGTVHSLKKTAYKKLRAILKEEFFLLIILLHHINRLT